MPFKTRQEYNAWMNAYQTKRRAEMRAKIVAIKLASGGCSLCGEADPRCLDFHHRNPATKHTTIAYMAGRGSWSWDRVVAEMDKCDLICSNCHRKKHSEPADGVGIEPTDPVGPTP